VKATLTAFNPCVVTSHFALYTLPVLDVIRDRPFVVHFHGPWAQESALENEAAWKVALKSQLERTVYRRADRFVVLSEAFRDVLVNSFGVSPARIRIVPGGVDVDRFDVPGSVHDARTRLGLPSDRPIVVSVRRLVQRMGLETLIDAWADVRAQYPDVLLLLAGKGPLAPRLQARIDAHDLQHHVRLLGFVPDEDLPYLYRAADLSIIPTMGLEGFGLISVESLAAGTPVLATPVGGLPEVLGGLSNDLLLPGGTADVLSDAVVQALSGRLNLPSGSECAAFAREQYSWARIAELTRLVYRELA
jgi:glycosyltransferase involved in cell wall biosynthesis